MQADHRRADGAGGGDVDDTHVGRDPGDLVSMEGGRASVGREIAIDGGCGPW